MDRTPVLFARDTLFRLVAIRSGGTTVAHNSRSISALLLLAALAPTAEHELRAAPRDVVHEPASDSPSQSLDESDTGSNDAGLAQAESLHSLPDPETADDLDALLDLDITELSRVEVAPDGFSSELSSADVSGAGRQAAAASPGADIISGGEAATRNTTDAGSFLRQSQASHGVYVQQRNPIIGDPRVRGYHFGQYLARADGAFWFPARQDADSIISKIDSWMIDDVVVLNGPYSARYGPTFSVIDIATRSTPRYEWGRDTEGSTGLSYNANGQQWNGHQYVQTGAEDWGALVYYSHMTGSDYEDGAGRLVPSSYKSRNVNAAVGTDLSPWTSVEFRYLRQDQTDVELAGQFTDIDFLATDGFALNATSENTRRFDLMTFDAWYNQVRGHASGERPSKQELFNEVFDAPAPNGGGLTLPRNSESDFDVASAGYTLATTWGQPDDVQATIGTDLRYYERGLSETSFRPAGSGGFRTATRDVVALIPDSQSTNPGVLAELVLPVTRRLKVATGGRVDWVSVSAGSGAILRRGSATPLDVLGPDRDNSYNLWSAYVTGQYDLTPSLTANTGLGLAQRPPTLTELYAMRPFESVLQQGLNRIQGYPLLRPERLTQLDVGLQSHRERFRGGFAASTPGSTITLRLKESPLIQLRVRRESRLYT